MVVEETYVRTRFQRACLVLLGWLVGQVMVFRNWGCAASARPPDAVIGFAWRSCLHLGNITRIENYLENVFLPVSMQLPVLTRTSCI
jgi:hypothetical protein